MLDDKISQDSKAIKETYLASESDIEDVEMTEAVRSCLRIEMVLIV